ncbi:MAG: hypothetical protein RXP99_02000 [Vulcanisaeta sp.]|jgi:hypothetical protein|nr:hypothetical protein [Vulcanisaeta sp.]MCG2886439.1 hypothetical protein [Vulcanisaeta sp.]
MIEIRTFKSMNELIQFLKSELGNEYRFLYVLRQRWQEILGAESNGVALASEISEVIRFLGIDGSEVFSLRIVYKPGTKTRSEFINDVAGYVQRKSAVIKAVIDRLESLGDRDRDRPVTALLVDSIPVVLIMQGTPTTKQ